MEKKRRKITNRSTSGSDPCNPSYIDIPPALQQLLIKCWNVYFLPYAFLKFFFFLFLPPSLGFVCLPQKANPHQGCGLLLLLLLSPSFVSISLFPLPLLLLLLPPLLNINLFCFPSHWSPALFPQSRPPSSWPPFPYPTFRTFCRLQKALCTFAHLSLHPFSMFITFLFVCLFVSCASCL